ncbi:hypothetical protein [Candidatus Deianiraea vastatrix]|uniref:Uncharacterized protein n=1 Tax=Candidatus Deianiraea vastatrix TaxID=2163644 RepID=A0A5B8XCQ3_9RICK|nr:hypothetical protein [Candidatus Deianiraea vastatrix]QED23020.1 hypothetical protein Deia_00212 [Candidatus Deianiraea vastatrix]
MYFIKIGKELTIQAKTQRNCYLLQTINDNLRLFNESKDKKIELSKILNNQNEMYKLLIEDIEKPVILNELLRENREFGMITNVSNAIYNAKSPVNKELISITTEPKNHSKIPSKVAIRNEYESHYTEHPVDYNNKEELEIEIYNKLKPNYPTLSKTIIQKIGKEVRKEKNMNKQGRPKYRGPRGQINKY